MKITLSDKEIRYALELNDEELARLLRYRKLDPNVDPYVIVSPLMVVCNNNKHIAKILDVKDWSANPPGPGDKKIPPFDIKIFLSPDLFKDLTLSDELILLFRVRNIPSFVRVSNFRIEYDTAITSKNKIPALVMRAEEVKPITDLLRMQMSESTFYEIFIQGKNDDFYDATGESLDGLVGLVGIKRMNGELDIELRNRTKGYLKFRISEILPITDEDVQKLVKKAEEEKEIEDKISAASKPNKRESNGSNSS